MVGAVIIYSQRNIRFVDALFFACGAATQSGLNTIDINTLKLYQQIIMHLIPLITNPIFISTAIVFVRIHWFEKRLESLDAKLGRWKTATKSRHEPQDVDPEREERGVAGRPITLIREAPPPSLQEVALVDLNTDENQPPTSNSTAIQSPASSKRNSDEILHVVSKVNPPTNGDAHTADRASEATSINNNSSDGAPTIINQDNGQNTHIVFADNQRPPKKHTGVLRIPSPREFERGGTVEDIEEDDPNTLRRSQTTGQVSVNEDPGPSHSQGRMRRRMGSITERIIPRSQTLEAFSSSFSRGRSTSPMSKLSRRTSRPDPVHMPYLSYTPTVGRNSAFVDLTEEQKDELGGLEYRALKLLAKILVGYMIIFQVIGLMGLLPWIMTHDHYGRYVEQQGISRVWWVFFTINSAFNDVGFTLTPDSMVSFQRAVWPLMLLSFLIVIGNTGFPCLLRLIIWVMKKVVPAGSSIEAVCRSTSAKNFLLDSHPRRCFTLLFPAAATWWLFAILVILNLSDVILFIILDLNDPDVMAIPVGYRVLSGWFQSVSSRTAGFAVVNLAALHPAMQVTYMVMMYISIFPIAISVRRTNVYEESALGIYAVEEEADGKSPSFVGVHLRNQLQYDLWYIFLGLFIIAIVEGNRIESKEQYAFTLFAILFEVVSAYGTVGLSMGYPDVNTSFSGQFKTISKLAILAMQIRGRHRGLPYQVDRAILLPSESLLRDQRLNRRPSFVAGGAGLPLGPSLSQATSRSRTMARSMAADDRDHRD
ncbi:cation transport protein-domain-containing protein [Tirmania nivea]|nr:cation transport protein-domain-containing protein [Tirmania nivea]